MSLNPRLGKRKYRVLERQSTHEHPRTKEIFCTGDEIQMAQDKKLHEAIENGSVGKKEFLGLLRKAV